MQGQWPFALKFQGFTPSVEDYDKKISGALSSIANTVLVVTYGFVMNKYFISNKNNIIINKVKSVLRFEEEHLNDKR